MTATIFLAFWLVLSLVLLLDPNRSGLLQSPRRLPLATGSAWYLALLTAVAGAGIGWVVSGLFGLLIGVGVGWALGWRLHHQSLAAEVEANRQLAAALPLVLNFLASVVDSGAPLRWAAESVSSVVDDLSARRLQQVLAHCEVGFSDAEAWQSLSDDPVWGEFARELSRCVESGSASAEILRAASKRAQKAQAAEAITKARSVGVASTLPLVSCFLPAFLLVGVVPIIGGLIGNYLSGS